MSESETGPRSRRDVALGTGSEGDVSRESDREAEELVRHEDELDVGKTTVEAGSVRARKSVETRRVTDTVPRSVEHFDEVERVPVGENDSGEVETLPDGSVSIPILEEELVVTKRIVARERVIVRKRTETKHHRIEADLRRERVEVDVEDSLRTRTEGAGEPIELEKSGDEPESEMPLDALRRAHTDVEGDTRR